MSTFEEDHSDLVFQRIYNGAVSSAVALLTQAVEGVEEVRRARKAGRRLVEKARGDRHAAEHAQDEADRLEAATRADAFARISAARAALPDVWSAVELAGRKARVKPKPDPIEALVDQVRQERSWVRLALRLDRAQDEPAMQQVLREQLSAVDEPTERAAMRELPAYLESRGFRATAALYAESFAKRAWAEAPEHERVSALVEARIPIAQDRMDAWLSALQAEAEDPAHAVPDGARFDIGLLNLDLKTSADVGFSEPASDPPPTTQPPAMVSAVHDGAPSWASAELAARLEEGAQPKAPTVTVSPNPWEPGAQGGEE